MKILKKINKCRICNSKNIRRVLNLGKSPIGENFKKKKVNDKLYKLNLQQCKNCGNCQIEDVIDPKVLYKDYLYQSNTSTYLDNHFAKYATQGPQPAASSKGGGSCTYYYNVCGPNAGRKIE